MTRVSSRRTRCIAAERERGNAQVEFIGVIVVVLIPVLYFIVAIAHVQSALYAAETAAHEAARAYALAENGLTGNSSEIRTLTERAFIDQGLAVSQSSLAVTVGCTGNCSDNPVVESHVQYSLGLPLLNWTDATNVTIRAVGYSYRGELRATSD